MASSRPLRLCRPSGHELQLDPAGTSLDEVKDLRSRAADALDTFHGAILLIAGGMQLSDEDMIAKVVDSGVDDETPITITVVQLGNALEGQYHFHESGPGTSWGSCTRSLTILADGDATFYSQDVADRDTDFTYSHKGHCVIEGKIVTFHAEEKTGKCNYNREETSASDLEARFLIDADGNLQQLEKGSDDEVMTYTIGYGEGTFPSLLKKQ
eukprot:TRINITY_DN33134_c0_g1_i1.p1 TRINITY_DN33134_c0_g1~~TRINITY_DN33134_c0_g1_i1.p1  ORF type:complete len:212 (-),score=48.27 TRINITY_DN33134_c0_g1_i1:79-714(-)